MQDINPTLMLDKTFEQLLEKLAKNREIGPALDYYLDPTADLMPEN